MLPSDLRITRKKAKLSQFALGKLLGVSRITINRWEKGHSNIDGNTESALAKHGIAIEHDHSVAIYAYRAARVIFKKDHLRSLRMAKVTLMDKGAPDFTHEDMQQLASEYPDILEQANAR